MAADTHGQTAFTDDGCGLINELDHMSEVVNTFQNPSDSIIRKFKMLDE